MARPRVIGSLTNTNTSLRDLHLERRKTEQIEIKSKKKKKGLRKN